MSRIVPIQLERFRTPPLENQFQVSNACTSTCVFTDLTPRVVVVPLLRKTRLLTTISGWIWPAKFILSPAEFSRARGACRRVKVRTHISEAVSASDFQEPERQAASESVEPIRILFAAGGTGGHVYPAIAIADAIKDVYPTVEISFAGTRERMEWTAVPKAGYPIFPVKAVSIQRPLWSPSNLFLPFRFLQALVVCWNLIGHVKPHVVVGTGGYVSAPTCLVGWVRGCQVAIAEQNAYAGLANRLVCHIAAVIFVAFEAAKSSFPAARCTLLGNPVRAALLEKIPKHEALDHFFPHRLTDDGPTSTRSDLPACPETATNRVPGGTSSLGEDAVLVLGGSLGAGAINEAVREGVAELLLSSPFRHVIWQTGARHHEALLRQLAPHPRLAVVPFIDDMSRAYAAADVAIARAGAGTCSELMCTGTPSILVPSPNVAEDHQTKNGEAVVRSGAARLIEERHLSSEVLVKEVLALLGNKELLASMQENALGCARPSAAADMAQVVIDLAKLKTTNRMWWRLSECSV